MAYENKAGLGVNNQYGPRKTGGEQGVNLTDGAYNEYVISLPLSGIKYKFPVRGNVRVVGVDVTFATGTVSALTIGGVAVLAATAAAPVALAGSNTGVVAQTGGTAGTIIVKFANVSGDAFDYSVGV